MVCPAASSKPLVKGVHCESCVAAQRVQVVAVGVGVRWGAGIGAVEAGLTAFLGYCEGSS